MPKLLHQFRDKRLQIQRSDWTVDHFQIAIAELRRDAKAFRERAEWKDQQADDLRQEAAAISTLTLPLWEGADHE